MSNGFVSLCHVLETDVASPQPFDDYLLALVLLGVLKHRPGLNSELFLSGTALIATGPPEYTHAPAA